MKKNIVTIVIIIFLSLVLAGCNTGQSDTQKPDDNIPVPEADTQGENNKQLIPYRFADKEEGVELMMSHEEFFNGFSANELDYKMQKKDADLQEYMAFARDQVLDFSEEEKDLLTEYMTEIEKKITDNGYHLPPLDEAVFICTTMK